MTAARTFSLAVLAEHAREEAHRIRTTQDALVANQDREAPDPEKLEAADKFECIGAVLDRARANPRIVELLKQMPKPPGGFNDVGYVKIPPEGVAAP